MALSDGVAILPKRLCVFVDGENFRYSLGALFHGKGYGFDKHNYLPDSDWTSFFRSFIGPQGVDTQLATDMITLADIYDVALVVSGDADYIPPVSAVKNRGKLVYSVSFLTEKGNKLPGGAVRLERRVDGRIELPFDRVRDKLGLANQTKKRTLFQKSRGSEDPEAILEVKP